MHSGAQTIFQKNPFENMTHNPFDNIAIIINMLTNILWLFEWLIWKSSEGDKNVQ